MAPPPIPVVLAPYDDAWPEMAARYADILYPLGPNLLERLSFERNRSNDKKSLKIKMLEQALIEKVYQLFQ